MIYWLIYWYDILDLILIGQLIPIFQPRINQKYYLTIKTCFAESLRSIGLGEMSFRDFSIHLRMPSYNSFQLRILLKIVKVMVMPKWTLASLAPSLHWAWLPFTKHVLPEITSFLPLRKMNHKSKELNRLQTWCVSPLNF